MNFVLLGAAGYVAPRHMKAIKDLGGNLIAICDPHDSVGVIDQYFKDCLYFKDFERLDRYCYKLKQDGINIDYVSITTPNFLHDAHCRWGLRLGANVICEKPLVLTEENLDNLLFLEQETEKNIYGLYQLRYHPETKKMFDYVRYLKHNKVEIKYHTPRGNWYQYSWKGYKGKSGGIETNIGCHLFDICCYLFGEYEKIEVDDRGETFSKGKIYFKNSEVIWDLSIDFNNKPERQFKINGMDFSFNSGFTDLHTHVYNKIINGKALSIENHRQSIKICDEIKSK